MPEAIASWDEQWREALGPLWRWQLALIALLLFAAGFSLPFADPDLSIHLATGEWVAKHHAVPFVEPFAWTRPGAPFPGVFVGDRAALLRVDRALRSDGVERASGNHLRRAGRGDGGSRKSGALESVGHRGDGRGQSHRDSRRYAVRSPAERPAHCHTAHLGAGLSIARHRAAHADAGRVDVRQRGPGEHALVVSHRCGAVRASADQPARRS